ncbi:hypothetical protein D9758_016630 [Tetrapyrgos nigripes]|uniref:Cytochrome P450 n=1 Tax=Tetrapyrgos nigripes TaxID=182062 RepID=A0A8H5BYS1_9AGAR|nr:hypothetical protein D9758_016630 [Tetrapyrgos nigripes]
MEFRDNAIHIMVEHFRSDAIAAYHPYIRQATSRLLRSLSGIQSTTMVTQYDDLQAIVRQHAASIILYTTYGITEQEDMDAFIELVNNAAESINATAIHGSFLMDYFPLLRYVPAWFPGAHFKRKAVHWAQSTSELVNKPWNQLRASISSGTAISCFGTKCLQKLNLTLNAADATEDTSDLGCQRQPLTQRWKRSLEIVLAQHIWVSAMPWNIFPKLSFNIAINITCTAGADTSVSLILISVLVLSHHPEVQAKAQEELDQVLSSTANSSQLPDFSDRGSLQYVEAIFKEILRMYPGVPLGTTVVANAWTEPQSGAPSSKHSFNPDPELYAFGFGRRICPGRHLALDTSWLVLACILATCNITRISSDKSKEIDPIADFADGLVAHPQPFKCCIIPRSAGAFELMKSGYEAGVGMEA